ncbi:nucleoside deaminase [Microbaculum marinisediminis]|uniref:Nucleoside deaminase n=1 Tax=Microbaculum marinisediminis TaxID=2931392 RepID=A0AAW5R3I0_9HYPH|nr:nucleoside deaminase [Microbaculum sp. A6E488]MCT8974777.1 nucleoside deaminase [Microbaculum sp. A6E488]
MTGETNHTCCRPTRRQLARIAAGTASALAPALLAPVLLKPRSASAGAVAQPARPEDDGFMRQAVDLAASNTKRFAAVIVRDGAVIARGFNPGRSAGVPRDPTAHGEMVAIRTCIAEHGAEAMHGATLYTTGEPCPMCMGAIVWCGFGRVVYGVSIDWLSTRMHQIMVPSAEIAAQAPFRTIEITGGVLLDETKALFG